MAAVTKFVCIMVNLPYHPNVSKYKLCCFKLQSLSKSTNNLVQPLPKVKLIDDFYEDKLHLIGVRGSVLITSDKTQPRSAD